MNGGIKKGIAYEWLKHVLIYQQVPPHTRLDLNDLADRLNMSIAPVRDALAILVEEGLIRQESDKSFYSKPVDARSVQSDYEMALIVLKQSIKTGSMRFFLIDFPDPYPVFRNQHPDDPNNIPARADYIEDLCLKIASASPNYHFPGLIAAFNNRTSFIRQLDVQQIGRVDDIADDFADLIGNLKRGDVTAALANLDRQYSKKVELLHHLVNEANLNALNSIDTWPELHYSSISRSKV